VVADDVLQTRVRPGEVSRQPVAHQPTGRSDGLSQRCRLAWTEDMLRITASGIDAPRHYHDGVLLLQW
jgi:hypothetical protein